MNFRLLLYFVLPNFFLDFIKTLYTNGECQKRWNVTKLSGFSSNFLTYKTLAFLKCRYISQEHIKLRIHEMRRERNENPPNESCFIQQITEKLISQIMELSEFVHRRCDDFSCVVHSTHIQNADFGFFHLI